MVEVGLGAWTHNCHWEDDTPLSSLTEFIREVMVDKGRVGWSPASAVEGPGFDMGATEGPAGLDMKRGLGIIMAVEGWG